MMKKRMGLEGNWMANVENLGTFHVTLPGTLDTNGIGNNDEERLETRLTRLHTHEGKVSFSRQITIPETQGKRLFLKIERTRELSLEIDGEIIKPFTEGSLSTPWLFELTRYAAKSVTICLVVDNYYTLWPRDSIIRSSAATDETQTNWNGILGDFAIYEEEKVWFKNIRIYPAATTIDIKGTISGLAFLKAKATNPVIRLQSQAIKGGLADVPCEKWLDEASETQDLAVSTPDECRICISEIPLDSECLRWDEGEGNLYTLSISLVEGENITVAKIEKQFGIRTISVDEGYRLRLNGRRFFLRGEANCCVFPETGHPPMDVKAWEKVLKTYASYGVNCMRFHSWCPPEAAFEAADKLGMMMQPELSQWNPEDAFGDTKALDYYKRELFAILDTLANHPSFVMLTFGNELKYTPEGYEAADQLLDEARAYDHTRLYANSSNYRYGETNIDAKSDFYTSTAYHKNMLRATKAQMKGHLNEEYPSAKHTYDKAVTDVHREGKPVYGFEVGQYEIMPDFSEIPKFQGVTRAVNLQIIMDNAADRGLMAHWDRYVEASGRQALFCYKEEVEAVLRTEGMSGLSLLGLQDFPGQGVALCGMLNSHLEPKPYDFARPERFNSFFGAVVPLLYLDKYTYIAGETLDAECRLAHYGREKICCEPLWTLEYGGKTLSQGRFPAQSFEPGQLIDVGKLNIHLPQIDIATRYDLKIRIDRYENSYPLWLYPDIEPLCPEGVLVSDQPDEDILEKALDGGTIFLEPAPDAKNFPKSIKGAFTNNFWSVGTFPDQPGSIGLLIDTEHPALSAFPTEFHSNYQWWPMACGRPMILPDHIQPVVMVPDSPRWLKHMGLLFEASLGRGHIMVSSMGLLEKQQYPECRGLLKSILDYLGKSTLDVAHAGQSPRLQAITREELLEIIALRKF